jgi:hypothetical protein
MQKYRIILAIGLSMAIAAIGFVGYALWHPTASFPWSNTITYGMYLLYLLLTLTMFVLAGVWKRKSK